MKKHALYWVLVVLLSSWVIKAQDLTQRQHQQLLNLGVSYDTLWQGQARYNSELLLALKKHRKHKKNKVIGSVLGGVGILSATTGVLLLTQGRKDQMSGNGEESALPLRDIFGGVLLATGALEIGVSIPFFVASKKRKKERSVLLEKHKNQR